METGLSVAAAQERILARFHRLPSEAVSLAAAHGRTLAADAIAAIDLPPFTQSAMDGYAVRAQDTTGALGTTPVRLRVVGSHAAGDTPTLTVMAGTAVAIATGGALPAGADAVVRIERTDGGTAVVAIHSPVASGANVRVQGESMQRGTTILSSGCSLNAGQIALLAATGNVQPSVARGPRVAIISTGNELVPAGTPLQPGQTWDVNGPMLTALVTEAGGDAISCGISPDTPEGFLAALRAVGDVDCIVTTGGVSVGTFDVVRTVLAEHGALHFWRVRMRPGAPFAFGAFARKPVLALPGNPVAAFVAFAVFVHPALMRMLGQQPEMYRTTAARLVNTVEVPGGLQLYLRARLSLSHSSDGRIDVDTTIDQAVGNVAALAAVDALVIVPEGVTRIETGTVVDTILLRG